MHKQRNTILRLRFCTAYRRAFEDLNEALDRSTTTTRADRLHIIRRVLFGDVPELEASGTDQLPE